MFKHKYSLHIIILLILSGSLLSRPAAARESGSGEYQVKTAMLYNLVKFVDWPPEKTDSGQKPFKICVIGRNPFGSALDSLNGKPVKGRKLMSVQLSRINEIGACQALFVGSSEKRNLAAILDSANSNSVLTVSEISNFAASGGMIGLVEVEGKIRLEVNVDAAKEAKLNISSQLLKLARLVKGTD
jgi:hypothetical protein